MVTYGSWCRESLLDWATAAATASAHYPDQLGPSLLLPHRFPLKLISFSLSKCACMSGNLQHVVVHPHEHYFRSFTVCLTMHMRRCSNLLAYLQIQSIILVCQPAAVGGDVWPRARAPSFQKVDTKLALFIFFLSCWWRECAAALCDVCVVLNLGQIDLICSSHNKNMRADLIALLKITWWDADIDMTHSWASHLCMRSSSHGWGEGERNLVIHIFIIFCCFLWSVHIVFDGVETWNLGLWC
jgi:hypothetical protein